MFISYLDLNYSLNGFLIISSDLLLILYFLVKKSVPVFLINFNLNFNLIYYLLFVICFYCLYFLCTTFIFTNSEILLFDDLSKFNIIKVLILYPILEEVIFRKYLLLSLTKIKSELSSILILSLGFTAIHFMTNSSLLYVFLLSVFFSWVYLKTKNIYLTIFLHVLNNILSFTNLINFLSKSKISLVLVIVILIVVILFTFFKIKNDKINVHSNGE